MSKYIIDLPDNVKKLVYFHVGNANAIWTTSNDLDDLEELNSDYINENFGSLQDAAYQKGFEDGKASIDKGCEGCQWEGQTEYEEPCMSCSKAFPNKYEPMLKDEICFGDEIVVNGERGVVVSHENEESDTIWALLNGYRTPQIVYKNNFTKTGRCFDMAGIMEAVKNG